MTEQRVNALGQTVEYNEDSGRWDKVVEEEAKTEEEAVNVEHTGGNGAVTTEQAGTGDPAPGDDETMTDEGATTQRKSRRKSD